MRLLHMMASFGKEIIVEQNSKRETTLIVVYGAHDHRMSQSVTLNAPETIAFKSVL